MIGHERKMVNKKKEKKENDFNDRLGTQPFLKEKNALECIQIKP